jgi:protein subunit release factor B
MIREIFSCVKRGVIRYEQRHGVKIPIGRRGIAASSSVRAKKMPDRPPLVNEDEFTESFLKGSGPGGQKIVYLPHPYPFDTLLMIL